MLVPDEISGLMADHILIGWKDTRDGRRAVRDALPFLATANRVSIVEICSADEEETAQRHVDDVARHLKRHKIKSSSRIFLEG